MGSSDRAIYVGLQATAGTMPTTMTNIFATTRNWKPDYGRVASTKITGTPVGQFESRQTGTMQTLTITGELYYDWVGILIAAAYGLPTTTGVTGDKVHVFKEVGTCPLIAAQMWDGDNWWQFMDGKVNDFKINQPNKATPTFSEDIFFGAVTLLGTAPTPVAASIAAYKHPQWPQFITRLSGTDYLLTKVWDLNTKRNIESTYTGNRLATPTFDEGRVTHDWSLTPRYAADAASLFAQYRAGTNPTSIEAEWTDLTTLIGTTDHPTLNVKIANPQIMTGDQADDKPSKETPIKGIGGYSTTDAAGVVITLTNGTASYVGS